MLSPEQQLGPYRLISRVGAGGMGEVWKAEDSRLGRVVAIKVLPPSVVADAEAIARLKREARTAAQIYHPSIATIHSIEQDGDQIFIVEEFVEGESLTSVIKRGGIPEVEICRIGRAVADALAEAQEKGIVHRDIKPDNIIVAGNRVKVLDFGIAKQVGAPNASPETFVTQQGMILGTVHYMSPEQALGRSLDGRTDVFSLGVVLYEMCTGQRPFDGETITETMTKIIRDEPADASLINPGVSPGLKSIIERSLRKNPAERFTAGELVTALDAQSGRAPTAPYTYPQPAAATAVVPVAIGAAAEPTVRTGPQVQTVQPPVGKPKRRGALAAVIIVLVIVLAAAAAVVATRSDSKPTTTQTTTTTQAVAPQSSTSVNVTAPPDATVEETASASTESRVGVARTVTTGSETADEADSTPESAPAADTQEPTSEADTLYAAAMAQIGSGDTAEARKTLHRVLRQDPHYAPAHFRMGEIALLNRNLEYAGQELQQALEDENRLDAREARLTRLGIALTSRDRAKVEELSAEIARRWPRDPDLLRMRATFPGMFIELPRERGHGRERRWQRP